MLKTTPLTEEYRILRPRFINFHHWKLPLEFCGAKTEHLNVRNKVGVFDISHMGKIRVTGTSTQALCTLERLLTNNVGAMQAYQAQYNLLCNFEGGILDDLIVYCIRPGEEYLLIVNGARLDADIHWMYEHNPEEGGNITNESMEWAMLALQGPESCALLEQVLDDETVQQISKFCWQFFSFHGGSLLVAATGYTGEKGFEILVPTVSARRLWRSILNQGKAFGCLPAGLAARDTLRMEMKYPLYGNDLDINTNPYSAGLAWAVKNPKDFIGASMLSQLRHSFKRKWVGFQLQEASGIPRRLSRIFVNDNVVGEVTSGAMSPCLNRIIGLGYVDRTYSQFGQTLHIEIHQENIPAEIVATPFIKK